MGGLPSGKPGRPDAPCHEAPRSSGDRRGALDHWAHWLSVGAKLTHAPQIFRVNWFRTGANGKYLWPGFGEHLRVLRWILDRCAGGGSAVDTAIGLVPTKDGLDRQGLDVSDAALDELMRVDRAEWIEAVHGQQEYLDSFGDRVPLAIREEHEILASRVRR